MPKKDDFETLEGGDNSSDALGFTDLKSKTKAAEADDESALSRPSEEHRFEGGDSDWDADREGADLEESGEEEEAEEPEEEVEEEAAEGEFDIELEETPGVGDTLTIDGKDYTVEGIEGETSEADEKAAEDIIKYIAESGDTKYIVKGREYDLRDLSPQEIKQRFSLAGRAFQVMQEVAEQRKELEGRETLAREGAERTQEILRRYGEGTGRKEPELPAPLRIDEVNDSEEVIALKRLNADLYTKVNTLEQNYTEQRSLSNEREYYRQLDTLEKEFPMLSKEEVSAVMAYYPNADIRVVAENSHLNRISDGYFDRALENRPDIVRRIKEEGVREYIGKKPKSTAVARRKSSSTVSSKASSSRKRTPRTFDEIEARYDDMKKGYLESLTEE